MFTTQTKNLLLTLIAGLGLMPTGRAMAQTFTTLHNFTGQGFVYQTNLDGADPNGVILSGNTLYGTAQLGGSGDSGAVYKVNTDGTGFTTLHLFGVNNQLTQSNSDGTAPGGLVLSGNTLYGTAQADGTNGTGTLFKVNTDGTCFTVLHSFTAAGTLSNSDGAYPRAGLIISGNTLYGTTQYGGTNDGGTVFAVNTDGSGFTALHCFSFIDGNGSEPTAGLLLSGNTLYGTAQFGGSGGGGTVFALNTDGTGFTNLYSFTGSGDDESRPNGGLIISSNTLYGTTEGDGSDGFGTVFSVNTDGSDFATLVNFNGSIFYPNAGLLLSGNTLYGTAEGGSEDFFGDVDEEGGEVFMINTDGTGFAILSDITNNFPVSGIFPSGLILSGNTLYGTTQINGDANNGAVFAVNIDGMGFTNLYSFPAYSGVNQSGSDGFLTLAGLTISGNTLYGTSLYGGDSGNGNAFALNTDGSGYTSLHSFSEVDYPLFTNSDGIQPVATLTLAGNTLYGTAESGGVRNSGAVFAVNTDGSGFTTLHSFSKTNIILGSPDSPAPNSDGCTPVAGLVLSGSTLYGTAAFGGTNDEGTVFAVDTDGMGFTTLHSFAAPWDMGFNTNSDGFAPVCGLVLSGNTLFGTTGAGGTNGGGTVFAINTDGTGFRTLHSFTTAFHDFTLGGFTNSDGADPVAGLILSGNTLYGTTQNGGTNGGGTVFEVNTDGTGFTTLHGFLGVFGAGGFAPFHTNSGGAYPVAGVILSGNNLYGTTQHGGSGGGGTVFALNTDGTGFTTLHDFTPLSGQNGFEDEGTNADGYLPSAGVILSGNTLYGTAQIGGSSGLGAVFSIALTPPPLAISHSGTNIILTWPTYAPGVTLLSTTNLVPPAAWNTVSPAPSLVNGQNIVTNPISGTKQFYRLSQ